MLDEDQQSDLIVETLILWFFVGLFPVYPWKPGKIRKFSFEFLLICVSFQIIFIFYVWKWKPLKYRKVEYPMWAHSLGFCMSFASMMWIPIFAVYYILKQRGSLKDVRQIYWKNIFLSAKCYFWLILHASSRLKYFWILPKLEICPRM